MPDKIDSNLAGLRYAEEARLGVLPAQPTWWPLEPNSFPDFGAEYQMVERNPINDSRQRRKGTTTGMNVTAGATQDLTFNNTTRLMQGFLFAHAREKATTASVRPLTARVQIAAVTDQPDAYSAAAMPAFKVGELVLATGFNQQANNGLKHVSAAAAGSVSVLEALAPEAAPPVAAELHSVGFEFGAGTISTQLNGNLVRLVSSGIDLTTLGLIPGEWLFVGGDDADSRLSETSFGFARISVITATYIELDKVDWQPAVETGAGVSLQIFYGLMIKNELKALIKRTSYHFERTLGDDENGTMAEYAKGCVANELTISMPQEDKITVDMGFIGIDADQKSGVQGLIAGARPELMEEECFNTSRDFARIKLAVVNSSDANPEPVAAFMQEANIVINNNANPNKALGKFGAFEVSVGNFAVSGSVQAYFNGLKAAKAIRDNDDVTLDVVIAKDNAGMLFDIPLLTLGNGKPNVEADQPIMLPLDTSAARSKFGNTLTFQQFRYLPEVAYAGA